MKAGEAHGLLFIDLVNVHLRDTVDPDDMPYAPEECGPCAALRDFWVTPRGRAVAQTYMSRLGPDDRNWVWAPGGIIDWKQIENRMAGIREPNEEDD